MGLDIPGGFIFPAGAIQVLVALPSVQGHPEILRSAGMSSGSSTHSADSHPTQILGQGQKLFFPLFINFFPFFHPGAALGSVWRRLGRGISCFSSTRDVNIPEGKGKGGGMCCCHKSREAWAMPGALPWQIHCQGCSQSEPGGPEGGAALWIQGCANI